MYKSKESAERAYAAYRVIKHLKRFVGASNGKTNAEDQKEHS
jgi:hypothetical protein